MLEPQTPAEGISLQGKYEDSSYYRVPCECGNPDCEVFICVEFEHDTKEITVIFETKQKTLYWKTLVDWEIHKINNPILSWIVNGAQSFINGLHQRLKITKQVWWDGYAEYQSHTIIKRQTALNMVEAIKNTIQELEKKNA